MMSWASFSLKARRALQTWQMIFAEHAMRRMGWPSTNPISRKWHETSGEAHKARMRTTRPGFTRGSGERTAGRISRGNVEGSFAFIGEKMGQRRALGQPVIVQAIPFFAKPDRGNSCRIAMTPICLNKFC
jgi:hypothetical protein